MAKRLSDLNLGTGVTPAAASLQQADRDVEKFLVHLEELVDDPSLQWARDTIEGITETIEKTRIVTSGQRDAIANIRKHQGDDTRRRPSRRYEGWRGSD